MVWNRKPALSPPNRMDQLSVTMWLGSPRLPLRIPLVHVGHCQELNIAMRKTE